MIHDISGKATILSIMNEIHSNHLEESINGLISYILQKRSNISNENNIDSFFIKELNIFLKDVEEKSNEILNFTNDEDIASTLKGLIGLCKGYNMVINRKEDLRILKKIASEKNIQIVNSPAPFHFVLLLVLCLKESVSIECFDFKIEISGIEYNFFRPDTYIYKYLSNFFNTEVILDKPNKTLNIFFTSK